MNNTESLQRYSDNDVGRLYKEDVRALHKQCGFKHLLQMHILVYFSVGLGMPKGFAFIDEPNEIFEP